MVKFVLGKKTRTNYICSVSRAGDGCCGNAKSRVSTPDET